MVDLTNYSIIEGAAKGAVIGHLINTKSMHVYDLSDSDGGRFSMRVNAIAGHMEIVAGSVPVTLKDGPVRYITIREQDITQGGSCFAFYRFSITVVPQTPAVIMPANQFVSGTIQGNAPIPTARDLFDQTIAAGSIEPAVRDVVIPKTRIALFSQKHASEGHPAKAVRIIDTMGNESIKPATHICEPDGRHEYQSQHPDAYTLGTYRGEAE